MIDQKKSSKLEKSLNLKIESVIAGKMRMVNGSKSDFFFAVSRRQKNTKLYMILVLLKALIHMTEAIFERLPLFLARSEFTFQSYKRIQIRSVYLEGQNM